MYCMSQPSNYTSVPDIDSSLPPAHTRELALVSEAWWLVCNSLYYSTTYVNYLILLWVWNIVRMKVHFCGGLLAVQIWLCENSSLHEANVLTCCLAAVPQFRL